MRVFLRKLLGADLPKVVTVTSVSRSTALEALHWLQRTGQDRYPLWCFCVEEGEPIEGFDRYFSGADLNLISREMKGYWAALSIISWTGEQGHNYLKLRSVFRPPFRILIINEAGDLFSKPQYVAVHALRRLNETRHNISQRLKDLLGALPEFLSRSTRQNAGYLRSLFRGWYWKTRNGLEWSGAALRAGYWKIRNTLEWLGAAIRWFFRLHIPVGNGIYGRIVFAFAYFAQVSTPLSRWMFSTFQGTQPLDLKLSPLPDLSVFEIRIHGRKWNHKEIARLINEAHESVVLFRQEGETADAGELLSLLREPDVFAAALQIQHTDWRKKLLQKFPFRDLQPGEVCRTMAPYSSLIAMRRDALAAFGMPNVISAGSAYLVFCWQAAAAGLHCLTLGSTRKPVQEVDVPLEHAEFVRVLLDNRKLRNLTPANPALSRGNISTSLSSRRPFTGNPRVLVLSPYLPYPLSHGGAVRIYNLCRALSQQIDFILLCYREAVDTVHYDVLSEIFREVHVVDNDEKNRDAALPKQIPEYRNSAMRAMVRHLCATRNLDLIQIEYTQMAEYLNCAEGLPVLLVEHDVTFTLYRQIWESQRTPKAQNEYKLWLEFETKVLREADCVWAMSNHDRKLILNCGVAPEHAITVPNGVDLQRFQPLTKQDTAPRVLFIGSFRHLPNLLAFEALRDQIMPTVWKTLPEARLHIIAGPQHERCAKLAGKEALLQNDARIHVEGFVEDVRAAYRDSDVVAIPLPVSAGTNIKLMEALACGRAVVSTPVGCVGLDLQDGVDLVIRTIEAGFAEAIIGLLQDSDHRRKMATQARRTAEERFGWKAIAKDAMASYETLLGATRGQLLSTK